jgi:transglutaminase-like putative cysteine protease
MSLGGRSWARGGLDVLVLTAALALALSPLPVVFGGTTALPALALGLGAGVVLSVLAGWRGWSALTVTAVVVVLVVLLGGPLIGTPTLAGLVPTPAGVRQVVVGAVATWTDVLTLTPPIGVAGDVLLAPFILALAGATTALTIALRSSRGTVAAVAAVVPVLVLSVSILLGTAEPPVTPAWAGTAMAVVLLWWAGDRAGILARRRLASAATLTVLALLGGYALVPVVVGGTPRLVLRNEVTPPFDPADQSSPLAAFRSFVKSGDEVLFTVNGLPAGARVRLATLDRYDGTVWNVAGGQAAEGSGEFRRVGGQIPTDVAGEQATVTVTIKGLTGVWLPTVGAARSFATSSATAAELRYNDATGAAVLTGGVQPGTTYSEQTVVPASEVSDASIGDAASADVVLPTDTGVPADITDKAVQIARDAGRPVQQARALASWLTETGYFSHGLTGSGDYPSLAGHGAARMSELIGQAPMVGDGEQYASALALMARAMKLKARVVLGFVPGSGDPAAAASTTAAAGTVEVHANDIQAWVEIAFAGHGWVAFDATPPTSRTPSQDQQEAPSNAQPQVVQPPLAPSPPVTAPQDDTQQPQTDEPNRAAGLSTWAQVLVWAGLGAAGLLVLAAPFLVVLVLKARRRLHRRSARTTKAAVAGGWEELVDAAHDLRRPVSRTATRREGAGEIARGFATAGTAATAGPGAAVQPGPGGRHDGDELATRLGDLAGRADRAVFAPRGPTRADAAGYWTEVEGVVRELRRTVPLRSRLRAQVSTRSLRRARPGARRRGWRPGVRRRS